jgi:hypothetical protein
MLDRVRVYHGVRTAHLERFHVLEPASVLYTARSYDFAPALLEGLDVHRVAGAGDVFFRLLRTPVSALEINEPLLLRATRLSLLAVAAVRLRGLVTRRRVRVVSYAIGNDDPFAGASTRLRSPWRRAAFRLAVRWLVGQVDRLAVGTPAPWRSTGPTWVPTAPIAPASGSSRPCRPSATPVLPRTPPLLAAA